MMKKIDDFGMEPSSQNPQNTQNIKLRDLYQSCKGHFKTKEDMQPGLDMLVERGFIRIIKEQNKKAGRPLEFIGGKPGVLEKQRDSRFFIERKGEKGL